MIHSMAHGSLRRMKYFMLRSHAPGFAQGGEARLQEPADREPPAQDGAAEAALWDPAHVASDGQGTGPLEHHAQAPAAAPSVAKGVSAGQEICPHSPHCCFVQQT
jgi:hypothetical protein